MAALLSVLYCGTHSMAALVSVSRYGAHSKTGLLSVSPYGGNMAVLSLSHYEVCSMAYPLSLPP